MDQARRELGVRKAGHAGTLDPQATGLMVLALGSATRWLEHLQGDKRYLATLKLGLSTDSEDIWGRELERKDASHVGEAELRSALEGLKDSKTQVPPMVSALKHQGKPLHAWARQGVAVERAARPLQIFSLTVLAVRGDEADFEVHCGPGTYVRSLCAEAGRILGVGACMAALRRTASGPFRVEEAVAPDKLKEAPLIGPERALAHLREFKVSAADEAALLSGRDLPLPGEGYESAEARRLSGGAGELLALGQAHKGSAGWHLHPHKVFGKA